MMWADISTRIADVQLGGEVGYDVSSGQVDKYSVALCFDRPREKFVIQALTGFKAANATYFQRFNDQLEIACKATWNGTAAPKGLPAPVTAGSGLEIGAKFYLLGGGFVKGKMDQAGRLGLAFATNLRSNVQLILGASIDTTKLKENVHKFGLDLTFSA